MIADVIHRILAAGLGCAGLLGAQEALSPADALARMKVAPGYEVTLFAAEPDIRKPIACAFDARGRMVLAEAAHYPLGAPAGAKPEDAIKILEDADGDGRAETITVFAEGLDIPDAVAALPDGILVAEAPRLWRMRDTDGDGCADVKEAVLAGFGRQDTHHMVHGLVFGPEGKLLMTQGCFVSSEVEAGGRRWKLGEGDFFRCWPDGTGFEIVHRSFTNSWGFDWNDEGEWFANDNEGPHLIHLVDGGDYGLCLTRRRAGKPDTLPGMAGDHAQHHGYLVMSGLACAPGGLVHQGAPNLNAVITDRIVRAGATWEAKLEPDLLRSDDPWFRPIALRVGPDGAIYVLDWCNRILQHNEHPLDSPLRDKSRGRIWRIVPGGFRPRPVPDFARAAAADLAALLRDDDRGWRTTAQRFLAARGAEAVEATLALLVAEETPRTRCHALWTLEETRLGERADPEGDRVRKAFVAAVADGQPAVRAAALRALRRTGAAAKSVHEAVRAALGDESPAVRAEAARAVAAHSIPLPPEELESLADTSETADRFLAVALGEAARPSREALVARALELGAAGLVREAPGLLGPLALAAGERTRELWRELAVREDLPRSAWPAAIEALKSSGGPGARESLARFLDAHPDLPPPLVRSLFEGLRRFPGQPRDDDVAAILRRVAAARADAGLLPDILDAAGGARELLPEVLAGLGDSRERVVEAAARAAGAGRLTEALPALRGLAGGGAGRPRWAATRALAEMSLDPADAAVFLEATADPDRAEDAWRGLRRLAAGLDGAVIARAFESLARAETVFDAGVAREALAWIASMPAGPLRDAGAAAVAGREGTVRVWNVCGPFPNPLGGKGHDIAYAPEAQPDRTRELLDRPLSWTSKAVDDARGVLDLSFLEPKMYGVAYAAAAIDAGAGGPAILRAGSDDSLKLWLNGGLVLDRLVDRPLVVDEECVPVTLKAGPNVILAKIGQNAGGWAFQLRVERPEPATAGAGDLEARVLRRRGDPRRGREAFFKSAAACARCHAVAGEGGRVGPDLTLVARRHPKSHILRSVTKPGDEVAEGFAGLTVVMKDGELLDGYVGREDGETITLVRGDGTRRMLRREAVAEMRSEAASGMPDGLAGVLGEEALADLLSWLAEFR